MQPFLSTLIHTSNSQKLLFIPYSLILTPFLNPCKKNQNNLQYQSLIILNHNEHMKKLSFLIAAFALVLLVGAGCSDTSTPQAKDASTEESVETSVEVTENQEGETTEEQMEEETGDQMEETEEVVNNVSGITLKVEAKENATLNLAWEVSDELKEKATGYRLLLDDEPNPQFGQGGYWFDRGPAHFEKEWTELPLGKQYVRVCVLEGTGCIADSNEVEVEVK